MPKFACVSNFAMGTRNERGDGQTVDGEGHYYWMIASFPKDDLDSGRLNRLADLCEVLSFSIPATHQ